MIKVFLIDKHPVIRQGLASVLEKSTEFQVVGDADSVQDAISQIGSLRPDIVIMDVFKSPGDSNSIVDEIRLINKEYSKAKVFLLTDSHRENDFLKAIGAGVRGYFSKSSEVSQLLDAIRLVAADGAVVYSSKVAKLFDSSLQGKNKLDQLSQREKEILQLVAQGCSNKEIARHCFVSEATVKAYLKRIAEKMNVKNRAEAVAIAIEKGLISVGSDDSDS